METKMEKQEEIDQFQSIAEGKLAVRLLSMEGELNILNKKEKKSNEEILLILNIIKQKNIINRCISLIQSDFGKVLVFNKKNENNS